ncbi:AAA family ATPase [Taibaiella soli]|nr:AAA family ATPase [Taibaiella soli]
MASVYGANAAGKSNLVKSIALLKDLVHGEISTSRVKRTQFKLRKADLPQLLALEFLQDGIPFYYGVEITDGRISTEELYISGLGKEDRLIFERKINANSLSTLKFNEDFEKDEKSSLLKSLLEDFIQPSETALKILAQRAGEHLKEIPKAFEWFQALQVVTPNAKPGGLAHTIDTDIDFKCYAEDTIKSFGIGISELHVDKANVKEVYSDEEVDKIEEIFADIKDSNKEFVADSRGNVIAADGSEIVVKQLALKHKGKDGVVSFSLDEESDGTVRLLDLIPAFRSIFLKKKVFIIDEIERSIHPLLIKELVKRFSLDEQTQGQLIFTTHESSLLDQEIFRQDEIWFAEKNNEGVTDLYSLSDFKEHKTIDIRKGYLTGRYGAIPFLANLENLNWHGYASEKK